MAEEETDAFKLSARKKLAEARKKKEFTTVRVTNAVREDLRKLGRGAPANNVIRDLLRGVTDVYVEFKLVDNELPLSHTIVFQLGEDAKSLYYWNGETTVPITVKETQKRLKQPKPNMTITREEAKILLSFPTEHLRVGHPSTTAPTPKQLPVYNRLHAFLEEGKKAVRT